MLLLSSQMHRHQSHRQLHSLHPIVLYIRLNLLTTVFCTVQRGAPRCIFDRNRLQCEERQLRRTDGAAQSAAGAGDLFAAGFLYGLMRGYPLQRCARIGCLAGGAVVQSVGAELSPANWRWLFAR